jgi:hypothetical protein
MSARTLTRLVGLGLVTALVFAAQASADSLVYIKADNVWLSNPDGSGAYQVTLDGTSASPYESPSQADDGTIVAVRAAGGQRRQLYRMTQSGALLNAPINTPAPGTGALNAKVSPDGRYVAYWFITTVQDPTCVFCVNLATRVLISHSERFTTFDEPGLTPNTGEWPSWATNDSVFLFEGNAEAWFYRLGAPEAWEWWGDSMTAWPAPFNGILNLTEGDVARTGDRIAVVRGNSQETLALYRNNGFPAPPPATPAAPQPVCYLEAGGKFFSPTWSSNGAMLAAEDPAGVETVAFSNFDTCAFTDAGTIAGASAPDFGPASINPGPRPGCGNPGNPVACGGPVPPCSTCGPSPGGSLRDQLNALLTSEAKALGKLKIRGLMKKGLKLTFSAPGPGTLGVKLARKSTVLASARHTYKSAGKATLTLRLSKKGKKALRRARSAKLTLSISFTPKGGKATTVKKSVTLKR